MPLDYKNLPLLLTVGDVAEMFRCSPATIRKKRNDNPNWLKPARHALMRKQLFATVDVLALLGHAAPVQSPSPLESTNPWDPDAAVDAMEQAKRERIWEQTEQRTAKYYADREAWVARVASHPPSARADHVLRSDTKTRVEIGAEGETFRFWIHFQPRFCPPGWPGRVQIPQSGPEWVRLETNAERDRLRSDIDEVMGEYQPQWDALVAERKRLRKSAKAAS
ncbi:hypothetical protein [Brevundimonas sp.]|uniref:hypothetical protein n=1 Tax=Brevundimonas sp. TaxID=1871086 RepID=UPI003BAA5051